jgi:N6-L-threonylcarbamoyladenine synthase
MSPRSSSAAVEDGLVLQAPGRGTNAVAAASSRLFNKLCRRARQAYRDPNGDASVDGAHRYRIRNWEPEAGAMQVLGIETTCDETAAAVVRLRPDGTGEILADEVMSQIAAHAPYGGVVPEIAARAHVEIVDSLVARALRRAKIGVRDLDGVAAADQARSGGVLVGLMTGKGIALAAGLPFSAVNHLEAHALVARLSQRVAFPYLLLLASGGHTQILAVKDVGVYERLGATMDDAIGEAFDKIAKMLGLPQPGGPAVEARAREGDPHRFALPRPLIGRPNSDFSLSGLKTATRQAALAIAPLRPRDVADLCASFQAAVVDVIEDRMRVGLRLFRERAGTAQAIVISGGVAANSAVREAMARFCGQAGVPLVAPPTALCTDNGAMIAWAGIERLRRGFIDDLAAPARPRWPLDPSAERSLNGKA